MHGVTPSVHTMTEGQTSSMSPMNCDGSKPIATDLPDCSGRVAFCLGERVTQTRP
jgi:hypothetical protein